MECATLFAVAYARRVALGALMLISDLPLKAGGVKTKESARLVFARHTGRHLATGLSILETLAEKGINVFGTQPDAG
jgi:AMP nucleosidase